MTVTQVNKMKYKTSAFVTTKCRLKVKSDGELTRMALIWRQNDVRIDYLFSDLRKSTQNYANMDVDNI